MCKCACVSNLVVADMLSRILYQDSRGDMAREIHKITEEYGLTLPKPPVAEEEETEENA